MIHKLYIISLYTFKQLLKSRILLITSLIGLLLVLITYVATEFTYGVPQKVAIDFGLGMLSISTIGISIFMGANLLPSEIDSRTVYMVISRPVPRWAFISGKLLGLLGILIINMTVLSSMTLLSSYFLGGQINQLILLAILFNFLECILLLLLVVFFSLFMNVVLSSVISFLILVLGHGITEARGALFTQSRSYLEVALDLYHFFLPGFYKLNLKDFVIYDQSIGTDYIINSFLYGLFYSGFLFCIINFIFNRKNLD